ncbi:hypothetical protein CFI00_20565 [Nocardioides sp. S5]|uniref:glycosyltransferase family 4 protein n=1 Tax=Nocardioides sp. S5 TaxID=2017486 RepID=UPI001A90419E|nr:glycosyltransferase family 4 protein [Nocardioides sp. S5]QSR32848.1 hypothetical protein CFI00_20565 [Nocardioides sp. S5]
MRLAFISHNRCGLNPGGLQRQIRSTKEALERMGHDVVLWNPWDGVERGAYDVAHFFSADHTLLPVHEAFSEHGIPTVLSPVLGTGTLGSVGQRVRRSLALSRFPLYQDLSRVIALVQEADVAVALHETEQALFELYGRSKAVVRVPNGVADVFRHGRPENGRLLAGTDDYYLHVGQFWPNKGQRWLIDNWDGVAADLVLVGQAPVGQAAYYGGCQAAAEGRRVRFLGGFPPDSMDLADLYAGARALVLNSQSEVAPIVINEAFAAKTPVVMPEHLVSDRDRSPDATFTYGNRESFRKALANVVGTRTERPCTTWSDVAGMLVEHYEAMKR